MHLVGKTTASFLFCLIGLSLCVQATAQDDVFGQDPNSDAGSPPPVENTLGLETQNALRNESNAVVRTLLLDPPKTPKDLAVAIKLMVRIQRWDEVSRWMRVIQSQLLDESVAVQLVDAAGTRTFSQVESAGDVLPPAETMLAQKILQLANSYRFNPKRLAKYAMQMRANDPATRLAGFRGIESTGRYGIASFLANVMAVDAQQPTPIMCEALSRLDTPAWEAWSIAIRTTHDDAKLNLAKLALGSRDPKFAPALSALIIDSDTSDEAWQPLREAWQKSTTTSDRKELARLASERLQGNLALYNRTRFANDAATSMRWSLGEDGRSMELIECRPAELLWSRLTFDADNVLRNIALPDENASLAYAVLAQNSVTLEQQTDLRVRLKPWLEMADFCTKAWEQSVKHDLAQAQRTILDDLGPFLATSNSSIRDRITSALDSGYSTVRYTAASKLMDYVISLDSSQTKNGWFGQSKLERIANEMASLNVRQTAYVIGGSSSLRNHLATLLQGANIVVTDFNNASSAISTARQSGAVDQVYVVSNVYEMSLPQLVQRLRATPACGKSPILMLSESMSASSVEFLMQDPRVVIGSVPPDDVGLAFLLERAALVQEHSAPMSPTDRLMWREKADAFFAQNPVK